ncbi:nucleotidyltransferase family protein [Colwellia psychrerythraea]|uniref:Nucleotidyltransferase family protein n=1 Tax=Colwellia psychrerythraea (strain 34H / ATCC BAA-681) TaxID=167879 RepID=Q47ZE1_COLP3|nr:nucleotidyltransferase family protein [Colwellia psychrerythraea]AAZ26855.1 hypothetical protein CPS_3132 [Colwellia psychrerythraea 34H]
MKKKLLNGQHLSLDEQIALLSEFVMTIDGMPQILEKINHLPNAWVGAGIIFQNVWNVIHGYDFNTFIKDIDVLYWDENDLSWQSENSYIQALTESLSEMNIPFDVKNIARVHLWYEERFGIPKARYHSVQESISTWPVIGACMAMRMNKGQLEFIAPFGFQDMFSLRVRPNKILVNQTIYEGKAIKWKEQWPKLSVENW